MLVTRSSRLTLIAPVAVYDLMDFCCGFSRFHNPLTGRGWSISLHDLRFPPQLSALVCFPENDRNFEATVELPMVVTVGMCVCCDGMSPARHGPLNFKMAAYEAFYDYMISNDLRGSDICDNWGLRGDADRLC